MENESLELAFGSQFLDYSGMDCEEVDLTLCLKGLGSRYEIALGRRAVFASDFLKKVDGAR